MQRVTEILHLKTKQQQTNLDLRETKILPLKVELLLICQLESFILCK